MRCTTPKPSETKGGSVTDHGHQVVGQRGPFVGVLRGLPGVEADVLQHRDPAGRQRRNGLPGGRPDQILGQRDGDTEQLAEPGGGGRE